MSSNQIYRGDPERKILYLVDDFSGGVNVVDVDGVVKDNEFRKLVNVELATKGLAQNRKGFKYVNMFDELLTDLSLTLPNPTHLFKIVRDTGNLLKKLVEFSFTDVQESQENTTWTHEPASRTLTISDFYTSISGETHDLVVLMANEYGVYSLSIYTDQFGMLFGDILTLKLFDKQSLEATTVETMTDYNLNFGFLLSKYDYIKLTIDYDGLTDFFVTVDNSLEVSDGNICDVAGIEVKKTVNEVDGSFLLTIVNSTAATITCYFSYVNIKPTKTNIKTVNYGDKIYFSTSDIVNSEDAIVVYDIITDTVSYIDSANYYEPNVYEIMNFGNDLGFNMLASNPISAIDTIDTSLKTFQTLWITNTSGQLLTKIPKNGQFVINLLTTGATLSPYEVEISLQNHLHEQLTYTTYSISTDGSVLKYTFDGASITGFSDALSLLIDVTWKPVDIEVVDLDNVSPKFYPESVVDSSCIYLSNDKVYYLRTTSTYGYTSGYSLLEIENSVENSDPSTADADTIFTAFKSAQYSGSYFEIFNGVLNERVLYQYQNLTTTFTKVYDSNTDGFTFNSLENVYPYKYSIFKDIATSKYYVVTAVTATSITYSELTTYNENDLIISLLEQDFEIGTSVPSSLSGINLADINIVEINGRMLYYKDNIIWFSANLGQFDYVPNNNYEILPINVNDEIVSINFFRGSYMIFTKERIYKMSKDYGASDFTISLVTDFVGTISSNSIKAIENSLYFLSSKGLYRLVLNYYVESLENLQKVDEKINNEIPIEKDVYSVLYNGQYWLTFNNADIDTVKYYYNIELANKKHPFTFDIYAKKPDLLVAHNIDLFAIKDNRLYIYDDGYTDFYYDTDEDVNDYLPVGEIELSNLLLGTPTHDKKFKAIYLKTYCDMVVPLYLTVKIDGYTKIDPNSYIVSISDIGEVLYTVAEASNLSLKKDLLGNFIIGKDKLGDGNQAIHKLVVAQKGKAIQLNVKFKTQNYFGIANIGILYKLGKVKENR